MLIPAAFPVELRGVRRSWDCSPRLSASLCLQAESRSRIQVETGFEDFTLATVNGQGGGWKSAPPGAIPACANLPSEGAYDQEVVSTGGTPLTFGAQSLRISNGCGSSEFFYQTYSKPVTAPAGETQDNTEFIGEFSFISKTPGAYQPGLVLSVSPDSYEGSRMSWVSLEDTDKGRINVTVADYPEGKNPPLSSITPLRRFHVTFHTRSGSGSRSTPARTTIWSESSSTMMTSVSALRRGRTSTAPVRRLTNRRTSIPRQPSTACSSAPARRGLAPSSTAAVS